MKMNAWIWKKNVRQQNQLDNATQPFIYNNIYEPSKSQF